MRKSYDTQINILGIDIDSENISLKRGYHQPCHSIEQIKIILDLQLAAREYNNCCTIKCANTDCLQAS